MAKNFNGKTYITLAEWLDAGNSLPGMMDQVAVPGIVETIRFTELFKLRFSKRYLFSADYSAFNDRVYQYCYNILPTFEAKIRNITALINGFMDDSETETSDTLRSPNGTLQPSGFSSGGVLIKRQGGSSGSIDRIVRYQNEVVSLVGDALDQFEPLFIGVFSEWGADDGN